MGLEEDIQIYKEVLRKVEGTYIGVSVYDIARDVRKNIVEKYELPKGRFTRAYNRYIVQPEKVLRWD